MTTKNLTIVNSSPDKPLPVSKISDKLREHMKEESRLVKGIFQLFECPGGSLRLQVKKYPGTERGGIPSFDKTMTDGETYEIPLYVARHLNGIDVTATAINGRVNTCAYPVHGFVSKGPDLPSCNLGSGPSGESLIPVPVVGVAKWKRRFGFQSLEFGSGAVA